MERMDALLYDCDIREPLFDYLEERFGKARMFEEKIIGKSRADVLMVTERRITGLEIKSDADTYERLRRQIRDYDKELRCNRQIPCEACGRTYTGLLGSAGCFRKRQGYRD